MDRQVRLSPGQTALTGIQAVLRKDFDRAGYLLL
jgi:hypothetical protein